MQVKGCPYKIRQYTARNRKYGAQQTVLNQDRKKDTLIRKIVYHYGNG